MDGNSDFKSYFACDGKFCSTCDNEDCHKTSDPEHWKFIPGKAATGNFDNLMKFAPKISEEIQNELGDIVANAFDYSYLESDMRYLYRNIYNLVKSVCRKPDVHEETKRLLFAIATNFKNMNVSITRDQKLSTIHQSLVLYMIYIVGPKIYVG